LDYLNPPGFLGTGASLLADVTLLAYIFLILPAMVLGFYFARSGKHRPHHRNVMIGITLVNWIFIIWLMVAAFRFDVSANLPEQPVNARYLFPAIHGALGLTAQLLGTYVVYRMIREDMQVSRAKQRGETQLSQYWFKNAKPVMRIVLLLWIITAAIGILTYHIRYNVLNISAIGSTAPTPVVTPEVLTTAEATAPVETPEVGETAEIEPPAATEEATQPAPETTPESSPVETEEIAGLVTTPEVTEAATQVAHALAVTPEVEEPAVTEDVPLPAETPEVTETETPEAQALATTPEVEEPAATDDVLLPVETPEISVVETEDLLPVSTEETVEPTATRRPPTVTRPPTERPVTSPAETPEVGVVATEDVLPPVSTEEATASRTPTSTRRPPSRTPARTATPQPEGEPLVEVGGNDELGAFLVDAEGRTLYVYANDEPNWSNCTGACLSNWEIYEVDEDTPLVLGDDLEGELDITERADGRFQLTYDEQPL
jgi:hypothetical protein